MVKIVIMLLIIIISVSIPLQVLPVTTKYANSVTDGKTLINKTIVLYNSYYPVKKIILDTNTPIYYNSQIQNFTVTNIDNDYYPDIVIWTLKGIYIWSWNKGIYAKVKATNMFDNPILVDHDGDGVVDYILLIDHVFYDANYYIHVYRNRIKTIVKIWYPLNNTIRIIGILNTVLISKTYVLRKNILYIPGLLNLYIYTRDASYTELGVAEIDLKTLSIKYTVFYREKVRSRAYIVTNDITTNYEAYLYMMDKDKLIYIPMGLDKLFILSCNGSITLVRSINLQEPNTPSDNMILIPRRMPPHSPETHSEQVTAITSNYFFYEIQSSDIYIDNEIVIIPYGLTIVKSPVDTIYGYHPFVRDKARFEKVLGVMIVDLKTSAYKKYMFIGQSINNYVLRAITSIKIINKTRIIVGGIAEDKNTGNLRLKERALAIDYRYVNNQWIPKIIHIVPRNYHNTRYLPVLASENYLITASYIKVNNTIVKFHMEIHSSPYPQTKYYWNPPILRPVIRLDIDHDGYPEYFSIIQYQRGSYSAWSYGPVTISHNPPYTYVGKAWILLFKHPTINIIVRGNASIGRNITLEAITRTTPISTTNFYLLYNNATKHLGSINGSNKQSYNILLDKPGTYTLEIKTTTSYYINDTLLSNRPGEKVVFDETINITLFTVKYKTRITIIEPANEYLTPNTYTPILRIKALLEAMDINGSWKPVSLVKNLTMIAWNNDTIIKDVMKAVDIPGTYIGEIHGLKPGSLLLTISFNGNEYYEASRNMTIIQLLKYPVTINIEAVNYTYALTPLNITIKAHYYKLMGNKWVRERLYEGKIHLETINNQTSEAMLVEPWSQAQINKFVVLPPTITISAEYIPSNIYYSKAYDKVSITILKLKIIHVGNTSVIKGKPVKTSLYEEAGEELRPLTAPYSIILMNESIIWERYSNTSTMIINTSNLKPGNYTVHLNITRYRRAYVNPELSWNISVLPLKTSLRLMIDPLVKIRGSSYYTYTLIPVLVKPLINTSNTQLSSIHIIIDNEYEASVKPGEAITVKFRDPGVHKVYAYTYYYGVRLSTASRVVVYPQPVKISVEQYSSELVVHTSTILGDPAPGNITVKLYSDKHSYIVETASNGKASITLSNYPSGLYMVEVIYVGNRSYLDASNTTTIYIRSKTPPLPEPVNVPILLLVSLVFILIKNIDKHRSGVLK